MADDNVVFENSTAIIAKLQETQRPFEMMVYPGATHAVTGEGRQTHVWGTIERFLDRTVRRSKGGVRHAGLDPASPALTGASAKVDSGSVRGDD